MNRAHLAAFFWLRWRLIVNQFTRSGAFGVIVAGLIAVVVAVSAVGALIGGFVVGLVPLRTAGAGTVMMAWDVAIVMFLFLWFVGLMSELQRSDAISLDRFLHLPVSPAGAFVINFVGSSVSLALVLMLPAMTGLAAGLVVSRGASMLVLFPLVAAFLLMMSALSYQFRGWLAAMMDNPRRRQTVIAVVPLVFILLMQLPNFWFNFGPGAQQRREARAERRRDNANAIAAAPESVRMANQIVPPGWLAYGAEAAASGRAWPAWAGAFGMALIGTVSLTRAYQTTLRLYKGDFSRGRRRAVVAASVPGSPGASASRPFALTEARLPGTSDRVSAVATATLRAWARAPEMKLALLTPVFMLVVFSRMLRPAGGFELLRPLSTAAVAGFVMIFGLGQLVGNQFGYDRAGFRAFVLSPMPRRDLLLGKNLAALPFALATAAVVVGLSQWFRPMAGTHVAGVVVGFIPMYLVFCGAANLLSILAPLTLKAGTGRPEPHQGARSIGPLVLMLLSPLLLGLTLWPLAVEAFLRYMNWLAGFPAYLVLGIVQVLLIVPLYLRALEWQGAMLHRREQTMLEIVASRSS